MPATYEPIATNTLTSTSTSVSFTSISAAYTDLILVIDGTFAVNGGIDTQFNSDTSTNYSRTRIYGDGTTAASTRSTSATAISNGYIGTTQSNTIININNYSNTTTYKTCISRGNYAGGRVEANVGLWRSTSAITSITLSGGTFQIGTIFTLYGIMAA